MEPPRRMILMRRRTFLTNIATHTSARMNLAQRARGLPTSLSLFLPCWAVSICRCRNPLVPLGSVFGYENAPFVTNIATHTSARMNLAPLREGPSPPLSLSFSPARLAGAGNPRFR